MAALVAFAAQAQARADRQELTDPESLTTILAGDPQGYTKYDINQPLFDLCTAWIADNVDHLNIKAVLCTGDLVEQNETAIPLAFRKTDQTSAEQWRAASRAFERLDNKLPYVVCTGNHDYGYRKAENSRTCFPDYFPFERNPAWRDVCVATYPNRNGAISLENAAFAFDDPAWGGLLVVTTEFLPRDEVLDWAAALIDKPEYRDVLKELKAEYARIFDAYFALELMSETIRTGELNRIYNRPSFGDEIYPQVKALNRDLFRVLYREYYDNCPQEYMVPLFAAEVERLGSPEAYAELMFEATHKEDESTEAPELEALRADIRTTVTRIFDELGKCSTRNLNSERLNELYTTYIKGLREWDTERAFYPDANLTLRVAYGKVGGYRYADGVYHKPYTTVEGILEKDNPEIYDYNIPQRLRDIIAAKDYGRWGVEIDGRTTVPVCFLADNHTTGGNSGSPVLNGRGELIGVNFDRTWLSTMSDIAFAPAFCRNIALDIRYVLFVIDRIGDASYLVEEMDFAE